MNRAHSLIAFSIFLVSGWRTLWAANERPDYNLLNRISTCRSIPCIIAIQPDAKQKTERTVLYSKWLLLQPSSREASRGLLENMPTTEHEVELLFTLPDWHEGATTSDIQMERLDRIYSAWPRLLSVAVQHWPEFLPAYIRYGRLAINDTHSDYTGYERNVCRANPDGFKSAFRTLSSEDQSYIRRFVFDPENCKSIFASEANE